MGQFKRDKAYLPCLRCNSTMHPITAPNGEIWDMIVIEIDRVKAHFALYVCPKCGASQIQRYKVETKKN